ncbi:M15 family metallopeptidase domain-containing protein [Novosphingobium gossypii]|uniref:M15 family peptidase n=1 Tax=Novosphingobium gossypii TaxID=1604774 RepID=UPI003D1A2A67
MTYILGQRSLAQLAGVRPKLVSVVKRAIALTSQDFTVQEGLRSTETQRLYVKRGVSKTMNSKHLKQPDGYGHAVDLVPWINGQPRWEWPLIWAIAQAVDQASEELGVKVIWGAVWDRRMDQYGGGAAELKAEVEAYKKRHPGPDFLDGPHYQLA